MGRRASRLFAAAALIALLLALASGPSYLGRYDLSVAVTLLTYIALAQAWNILAGYTGLLSLAVGALVGSGAYAAALLLVHTGASVLLAIVFGGAVAAAVSLVSAFAVLRLSGTYFVVGTLVLSLAIEAWIVNWQFAGGRRGMTVPLESVPDPTDLYMLALVLAVGTTAVAWLIRRSDFGLRLMAIRDDEHAARTLGVATFRTKLLAYVISGGLTGLVGASVALQQVFFTADAVFGLSWPINAFVMTLVGGVGTLMGPIVGAVAVYYLIQVTFEGYQELSVLLTGVVFVAVVRFAPQGLWGAGLSFGRWALEKTRRQMRDGR